MAARQPAQSESIVNDASRITFDSRSTSVFVAMHCTSCMRPTLGAVQPTQQALDSVADLGRSICLF